MTYKFFITMSRIAILIFMSMNLTSSLSGADYLGQNLDGKRYDATAHSQATKQDYYVKVEFRKDKIVVFGAQDSPLILTLKQESIDDIHHISAFDPKRKVRWWIDVQDVDE